MRFTGCRQNLNRYTISRSQLSARNTSEGDEEIVPKGDPPIERHFDLLPALIRVTVCRRMRIAEGLDLNHDLRPRAPFQSCRPASAIAGKVKHPLIQHLP